jgi:hypothetical protein
MRTLRSLLAAPILCAALSAGVSTISAPARAEEWIGRSVTLGGRTVQCHHAQIMIDRELPSEGGAGDDFVILNPDMLKEQPKTVRIFVFNHECGHLTVGDSELKADCYAVGRGVQEHWLDRKGLDQVCQSFDGAPETSTHPSAARRCRNLDKCYAKALANLAATPPAATASNKAGPAKTPPGAAPGADAVAAARASSTRAGQATASGPHTAISAWRCTDPLHVSARAKDPIAHLIDEDAKLSAHCH